MRKFLVLILFLVIAPTTLVVSIVMLTRIAHKQQILGQALRAKPESIAYAALPTSQNVFEGHITFGDKRIINLTDFLTAYHSPLSKYADDLVSNADQNNIDYRLLTAIAMQETTLCKKTLSIAPYNCWGWGIWGKHAAGFTSYTDAIHTISSYFGQKRENGIKSLDEIGAIYNPGNHSNWKENVANFMSEIAL